MHAFGAPKNASKVFSQIKTGDLLVFYILKPKKGIISTCKVTSTIFEDHQNIWGRDRYPLRVRIHILREFPGNGSELVPLSAIFGAPENSDIEIEPHLRNVWIVKITKNQYRNLRRYLESH